MTRDRPLVIFASYMIRYPLGGMISYVLQWLVGLQRCGCDVVFVERADYHNACYDPAAGVVGDDPSEGMRVLAEVLAPHGLDARMAFRDVTGACWGMDEAEVRALFARADAFVDMGTHGAWLDHVRPGCPRVLVDGEPGYRQIDWELKRRRGEPLPDYDHHFTNGGCIGTAAYTGPTAGIDWVPVYNPVVLDLFDPAPPPAGTAFTTVMNWQAHKPVLFEGREYGQKDVEFERFLELPRRVAVPLEVAVAGRDVPRDRLSAAGWRIADAGAVTARLDGYRAYIAGSLGEFSVCKHVFRATRSGWFSERSAAYMASGRPVVVQDTGFSGILPTGRGLHAVDDVDGAAAAIERVAADPAGEGRAARDLAAAAFGHDVVLLPFLARIGVAP